MSNHTPKPWTVRHFRQSPKIGQDWIAEIWGTKDDQRLMICQVVQGKMKPLGQVVANINSIAAVPDLIEACEKMKEALHEFQFNNNQHLTVELVDELILRAESALAKTNKETIE